jgi:hypothetical protein
LHRRLGELHSQSGHFGEEKNLLNMSGIEPQYRLHMHHMSYHKCPQALHVRKLHVSGKKEAQRQHKQHGRSGLKTSTEKSLTV